MHVTEIRDKTTSRISKKRHELWMDANIDRDIQNKVKGDNRSFF